MKKYVLATVGLLLGVLMVWLLFRDTDWSEVGSAIRGANYLLLLLALVPITLAHPARVKRWGYIVRAAYPASFREMFSATQIGFLANFTLPGRAGEVIRALVLTRLTRALPFTKSFAFVAVDRLTDLFGLMAVIGVAIVAFQPQEAVRIPPSTFGTADAITFSATQYRTGAAAAGVFLIVILAGYAVLYTNRGLILRISSAVFGIISKKVADYVNGLINHFADGLHIFRSPAHMVICLFWSLVVWGLNLLGLALSLMAFHIDFPWYAPVVMQAILSIFIAAPNTPGFVGQFHIPIVLALVMTTPDISVSSAKAYAIVAHLIQFPPIVAFGVWSLMREHMGLLQLQREGEAMSQETDPSGEATQESR